MRSAENDGRNGRFGYGDPLQPPSAASGHQRRIEIAAARPENDPERAIEALITPDGMSILRNLVRNNVMVVDDSLYVAADNAHVYVKSNYAVSNWVWDSTTTSSRGEQFNLLPIVD